MISTSTVHSKGQALPLALVLLAAVAAMMFFMFNSGQLVQEKIRLTNTADAVAYSAGVYEARVLNYHSYVNRAIIANEIAIGQAVGLASWGKYVGTSASTIAPYLYLIPVVGAALGSAMEKVEPLLDKVSFIFAEAVAQHSLTITALKISQAAVNAAAPFDRSWVMNQVAKKNDENTVVDAASIGGGDFAGFIQHYVSKDERKRLGQLVVDSRDAFLTSRRWDFEPPPRCSPPFVPFGAALRKRGSTEMVDLTEGWTSMDTLSVHTEVMKSKWWGGLYCSHSEQPIGYGTAFSKDGMDDSGIGYAGSRSTNPDASSLAESTVAKYFAPWSPTKGEIPAYYDLSESVMKGAGKNDPRASMVIRVSKSRDKQRFSGGASVVKPAGRLALYDGQHAKSESAAVARVEVFFERPDGKNRSGGGAGQTEYGSLFNPYWQVHLVALTADQIKDAQAKQGLSLP